MKYSRCLCLCLIAGIAITACAAAEPATDAPQAHPWLKRIEAAADEFGTLTGKVTWITIQGLLGDEQRRFGSLVYSVAQPATNGKPAQPARFALHIDRIVVDDQLQPRNRWYIFDGRWLAEKLTDEKIFIRRQLVADDAPAADLLRMSGGPFVLPLNLEKQQVLRRFDVTVVEPAADDPHNSVHLRFTPLPHVEAEQSRIDLWFDRDHLIPVRVHTINDDQTQTTLILRDTVFDPQIDADVFDTTPPAGDGWQVEIKPLESSKK